MTLALSKALEDGARAVVCASTGNTVGVGRRLRRARGAALRRRRAGGRDRRSASSRRPRPAAHASCRSTAASTMRSPLSASWPTPPGDPRQQPEPVPPRGSEDRGVRGHRRPRGRARLAVPAGRQRRQHHRVLAAASASRSTAATARGRRVCSPARPRGAAPLVHGSFVEHPETVATAIRIGRPVRFQEAKEAVTTSEGAALALTDEEILAAFRRLARERGRLLRAGLGGVPRGPRTGTGPGADRGWRPGRVHPHRPRAEGSRHGGRPDRAPFAAARGYEAVEAAVLGD